MHKHLMIILILLMVLFYKPLFIVHEGQRGIVLRFGKVLRDNNNKPLIYNPGLHIKIPFIETVKNFDTRIQTMENQADRFLTIGKKDLIIDSYIKWRISDFSRYYLATGGGDILQAEVLLKRKFSDRLRSELGRLDVKEIVTDSRNRLMTDIRKALNNGTSDKNEETKNIITNKNMLSILTNTRNKNNSSKLIVNPNSMATLGIEVVDVRIKQINLPTEVSDAIYQRMRAERETVARHLRSQGQEEAEKLRVAADYKVAYMIAEAERKALIIRGEADAETVKIYADAFSLDPEFYSFIRSLDAYKNSFNKNDIIILNSNNNFFRFMKN